MAQLAWRADEGCVELFDVFVAGTTLERKVLVEYRCGRDGFAAPSLLH